MICVTSVLICVTCVADLCFMCTCATVIIIGEIPAISKNLVLGDFDGSSFVLLVGESLLEKFP